MDRVGMILPSGPFGANRGSGVAYGKGSDNKELLVAVGWDGGTGNENIYTSTDGSCWNGINGPFGTGEGNGVAYGSSTNEEGLWVVVGDGSNSVGYANIYIGTDGSNWTEIFGPFNTGNGKGVAYGKNGTDDGLWVAVGEGSTANQQHIYTSTDGSNWNGISGPFGTGFGSGVAYGLGADGKGLWVAVGFYGGGGNDKNIYTSTDGSCWNGICGPFGTGNGRGVAYGLGADGKGLWVAVGDGVTYGEKNIYTSTDGSNWNGISSPFDANSGFGLGVAYGKNNNKGLWVAVGDPLAGDKNICTSTNGLCWIGINGPFGSGDASGVAADHLLYGMNPGFYK